MKRNIFKKALCVAFACCLALLSTSFSAAKSPKISVSSKKITAGKTFVLKISEARKTVKWSTSNGKVAKIKSTGGSNSCKVRIKAVKKGTATITAKIGNKKLKCKITVKKNPSHKAAGVTVYITNTGQKYHADGCRSLKDSKIKITLSSAKTMGYTACGLCHPPV